MTFLAPLAFALLALLPPIVALYFLKLRRQEHTVSSVYLWQRFVRDVEANAPWQRLRRNLLLILQILFMLFLIAALARPALPSDGPAGRTVVLILDTSASMAADDEPGTFGQMATRLATAQARARELVTSLPANTRVAVIAAAGGQVELLAAAGRDRKQTLAAVSAAKQTSFDSDLTPALTLAEALIARESGAEIILLSDGVISLPARMTVPVRLVAVGQSADNQALSNLAVAPLESGAWSLFVRVTNYSHHAMSRRLVVETDGAPFTALDLDLLGEQSAPIGARGDILRLPPETETVTVYLAPVEERLDVLSLDDRVWAVLRPSSPARVTLVSAGNRFLQTALTLLDTQHLGGGLSLTVVDPADWPAVTSTTAFDHPAGLAVYIFDAGTVVAEGLPPGNVLFIGPRQGLPGLFEVLGQAETPIPLPPAGDHPVLRDVNLASTQILTSSVLQPGGWAQTIFEARLPGEAGETIPLLLLGEVEGRRVVVLAFDPRRSDLPLRPAFPILIANLIDYLAPQAGSLIPARLASDEPLSLTLPPQAARLRLTDPAGRMARFEPQAGRIDLPPLGTPGLYQLTFEAAGPAGEELESATLAVNFMNPRESAVAPRPELRLAGPAEAAVVGPPAAPAHREWWRPLALVALVLLVIEWLVYRRGYLFRFWAALHRTQPT